MYMYEVDKQKHNKNNTRNSYRCARVAALKVSLYIDIVFLFLHLLVLWVCRVQHLFESRVALNSGLGGPKSLPVHRYSVVIFTFAGLLGL